MIDVTWPVPGLQHRGVKARPDAALGAGHHPDRGIAPDVEADLVQVQRDDSVEIVGPCSTYIQLCGGPPGGHGSGRAYGDVRVRGEACGLEPLRRRGVRARPGDRVRAVAVPREQRSPLPQQRHRILTAARSGRVRQHRLRGVVAGGGEEPEHLAVGIKDEPGRRDGERPMTYDGLVWVGRSVPVPPGQARIEPVQPLPLCVAG